VNNKDLMKLYNEKYPEGIDNFWTFDTKEEADSIVQCLKSWEGLDVLEIGCGEGLLSYLISCEHSKSVYAIDYSQSAIDKAKNDFTHPNLVYDCISYEDIPKGKYYDVIIMNGVLEHMDTPFETLGFIDKYFVKKGTILLNISPSFINPRGYIWMTLALLFNVPMSLSDLHFLLPSDFEAFSEKHHFSLEMSSIQKEWGCGNQLLVDYKKRLPNALHDAHMKTDNIPIFLETLEKMLKYETPHELSGANMLYNMVKC